MNLLARPISVGARSSLLSQKQVQEVFAELNFFHPGYLFDPVWVETTGDLDLQTSLRDLEKADFFTKEVEALQKEEKFRISIHSAKDLPEVLQEGLEVIAITKGISAKDVLLFREGESLGEYPKIGSSSPRRDEKVLSIFPHATIVDIRGCIPTRVLLLTEKKIDALVVAEAALLRLGISTFPYLVLPGEGAPLQGKLAVVARSDDEEMKKLFSCIDART